MSRLPRPLRRVLLTLIVAWALYLVAGNLFLNTALGLQVLNRHPERLRFAWSHALTWYPGQVSAWQLRIDAHVRTLRWQAQAAHASGRIALWPLLRRELRLPRIDADEVGFVLQRADEDLPPRPPRDGGWHIVLPQIRTASLRTLQWEAITLRGRGHAHVGLSKQLRGGPFELLPSHLGFHAADLHRGDEALLHALRLDAQFRLDAHRPEEASGRDKLRLLQARVELAAQAPELDLALADDGDWRVAMQRGDGRVEAVLALERGQLVPGGRFAARLPVSIAIEGEARRDNALDLGLDVGDTGLVLRAHLPQQPDGHARLDAELRTTTRALPLHGLDALLPLTSGHVDLRWRFDSLRWLSALLVKRDWLAFDGAGELDAALRIEAGQLAPGSRFEIPAVQVSTRVLDDRITGSAHARGGLAAAADGRPQARVDLVFDRFAMRADEEPDRVYVEGRALSLGLQADGDLARFRESLQARLRFERAQVPALTAYNRYLPGDSLRFTGGSGTVSGDLTLDADGEVAHGRLGLQARAAALRFAHLELGGDLAVDTHLARAELAMRRFDLDGTTIDLRNVRFRDAEGRERRDWWAKIALPRTHAEWQRPFALDGEARVEMRDVGFLLALFAQKKKFPKWLARVVDAGSAEAHGVAQLRGRRLLLDRLHARNDRFDVRARLRLEDAQAHGDLLLRWGVLALGVELAPQERDYRLIRATEWYESRPDLIPSPARGRK